MAIFCKNLSTIQVPVTTLSSMKATFCVTSAKPRDVTKMSQRALFWLNAAGHPTL